MNLLGTRYIPVGQIVGPRSHRMLFRGWVALAAMIMLAGCQQPKPADPYKAGAKARSASEAGSSESARFEKSKDPPINADTHFAAAQLAEANDNPQRAIEQYNEGLKLQPGNRDAMFRLGVLYTQQKKFPEAVAMWQRYIKATDGSAAGYNNLALCYQSADKPAEAEQAYKAAIAKAPTDVASRVNYGLMLAQLNRVDEATAQLGVVLKPAAVHYNLGAIYERQGRLDKAKSEFKKALELDPDLKDARVKLEAIR